jgi:hypothetical protein
MTAQKPKINEKNTFLVIGSTIICKRKHSKRDSRQPKAKILEKSNEILTTSQGFMQHIRGRRSLKRYEEHKI